MARSQSWTTASDGDTGGPCAARRSACRANRTARVACSAGPTATRRTCPPPHNSACSSPPTSTSSTSRLSPSASSSRRTLNASSTVAARAREPGQRRAEACSERARTARSSRCRSCSSCAVGNPWSAARASLLVTSRSAARSAWSSSSSGGADSRDLERDRAPALAPFEHQPRPAELGRVALAERGQLGAVRGRLRAQLGRAEHAAVVVDDGQAAPARVHEAPGVARRLRPPRLRQPGHRPRKRGTASASGRRGRQQFVRLGSQRAGSGSGDTAAGSTPALTSSGLRSAARDLASGAAGADVRACAVAGAVAGAGTGGPIRAVASARATGRPSVAPAGARGADLDQLVHAAAGVPQQGGGSGAVPRAASLKIALVKAVESASKDRCPHPGQPGVRAPPAPALPAEQPRRLAARSCAVAGSRRRARTRPRPGAVRRA